MTDQPNPLLLQAEAANEPNTRYSHVAGVGQEPPITLPTPPHYRAAHSAAAAWETAELAQIRAWLAGLQQRQRKDDRREFALEVFVALRGWAANERPGASKVLLGAIALALAVREKIHLDLVTADGRPQFAGATDFIAAFLAEAGLGDSPARVSRLRRGGDLWLALHEAHLPVPLALGPLESLLPLPLAAALRLYAQLATNGQAPTASAIAAAVGQMRNTTPTPAKARRPQGRRQSQAGPPWLLAARQHTRGLERALSVPTPDLATLRAELAQLSAVLEEELTRPATPEPPAIPPPGLAIENCGSVLHLDLHVVGDPAQHAAITAAALRRGWSATTSRDRLTYRLRGNSSEQFARASGERHWLRRIGAASPRTRS
jgi:hypothetical protein